VTVSDPGTLPIKSRALGIGGEISPNLTEFKRAETHMNNTHNNDCIPHLHRVTYVYIVKMRSN